MQRSIRPTSTTSAHVVNRYQLLFFFKAFKIFYVQLGSNRCTGTLLLVLESSTSIELFHLEKLASCVAGCSSCSNLQLEQPTTNLEDL